MKTEQIIEEVNDLRKHNSMRDVDWDLLRQFVERLKDYEIKFDKAVDIVNEMLASIKNLKS